MNIPSFNSTPTTVVPQARHSETQDVMGVEKSVAAPVNTNPAAVQATDPSVKNEQVEDAVKKINETVKSLNQNVGLEFSTDEDTKIRLVKLIDVNSKEVLRQIPTEEVVTIAKALDKLQGLLVRDKA